jgi:NAD(P)-dependent dehydrogenase (short-subunit alcohol dehydrogenase family)
MTMGMFDDKVALVTGAANGIGAATVAAFAAEGARVVACDIDGDALAATVEAIDGDVVAQRCDVAVAEEVEAAVAAALDGWGRLDFAHNNAGIVGAGATIAEMDPAVWQRGIDVMLTGVFYGLKYQIPAIAGTAGTGAIVNTSSGAGLIGFPGMANYVAAKHGVIGLTRTAALECATTGIRVNAICPGTARSRMVNEWMDGSAEAEAEVEALHPIGRIAEPEEIAAAVIWLCSDASSFVLGHSLVVDGGYTIQ